jgi:hypothetical protein
MDEKVASIGDLKRAHKILVEPVNGIWETLGNIKEDIRQIYRACKKGLFCPYRGLVAGYFIRGDGYPSSIRGGKLLEPLAEHRHADGSPP